MKLRNWKDNVIVYGQLYEISNLISAGYSILAYNFPNHPNVKIWRTNADDWNKYWNDLKNLVILSEEDSEREIDRLNNSLKELRDIQSEVYFLQ